jgi:hypothetical protein
MKNCGNKIKNTCVDKNYATCVYYELEVPTISSLVDQDCVTLEETTKDIYDILIKVKSDADLSSLGQKCLTYVLDAENKKTVKNVLLKYEQEICDLKDRVEVLETTAICDMDITNCGLNLPDTACDLPITKLGELLEYLLTQTA